MELVRHESCLEYFRRRLREGWKCVSLEGYNAVLLSPDGFRRELDLRNDVETLRPNGAGSETAIESQIPAEGEHWDKVDEESPDESVTCVRNDSEIYGWQRDLYALPAHSVGSEVINKITVYFRITGMGGEFRASIRTHDTAYNGSIKTSGIGYSTESQIWSENPFTEEAWTWGEIDALEAGVGLWTPGAGVVPYCTQVYVEVDYTLSPAETAYNTKVGLPTSWMWEKCDYDGAEKCPVGSEPSWAWQAPTSGGPNKTPQGGPTSFSWGSE